MVAVHLFLSLTFLPNPASLPFLPPTDHRPQNRKHALFHLSPVLIYLRLKRHGAHLWWILRLNFPPSQLPSLPSAQESPPLPCHKALPSSSFSHPHNGFVPLWPTSFPRQRQCVNVSHLRQRKGPLLYLQDPKYYHHLITAILPGWLLGSRLSFS